MFTESKVNRAVWGPSSMKLLHLNSVQANVAASFNSAVNEVDSITELYPAAADLYQMYDLKADPTEQNNVFGEKAYASSQCNLQLA